MSTFTSATSLLLLLALALGACERSQQGTQTTTSADAAPAQPPSAASLSEHIAITTTDGAISLALVRDTVSMGLTDSLRRSADQDMDTSMAHDSSDVGRAFGGFIKHVVQRGLNMRIGYPISEIKDVRYENGAIEFTYYHHHPYSFENIKSSDKPALASFRPADAERFVAAVRAAKGLGPASGS